MQYGPFTPQECEKAVNWLKEHNIQFEIVKDLEKENEYKSNTGANLVIQTQFRTETFLAQLYYIGINNINEKLLTDFNALFTARPEVFPKSLTEKSESMDLSSSVLKSKKIKRTWAAILAFILVASFVFLLFFKYL